MFYEIVLNILILKAQRKEQIGINVSIDNYGSLLEYNDLITLTLGQAITVSRQESNIPQEASGMSLFPNPAENQLMASWDSSISPQKIKIINVNGNEVYNRNVSAQDSQILNIERLSSGIYSVQLQCEGEVRTLRFVKK